MPSLPSKQNEGKAAYSVSQGFEGTSEIVYLSRKMSISPNEVLKLPHSLYLLYMKQNYIMDLEKTEEGREYLEKARRYQNPRKDADLGAIRKLSGYSQQSKDGDK